LKSNTLSINNEQNPNIVLPRPADGTPRQGRGF